MAQCLGDGGYSRILFSVFVCLKNFMIFLMFVVILASWFQLMLWCESNKCLNKCSVGMFVWIAKVYSVKGEAGRSLFRIEFLFHETYLSKVGDTG